MFLVFIPWTRNLVETSVDSENPLLAEDSSIQNKDSMSLVSLKRVNELLF